VDLVQELLEVQVLDLRADILVLQMVNALLVYNILQVVEAEQVLLDLLVDLVV
tara:strand:- start:185 stop:343 length:159 start_codon:yes stop_codon:yes gene_type:complete